MIYDISQPLLECRVYPGDSRPEKRTVLSLDRGDLCNLTDLSLCVHNGTHVDAPLHFIRDGKGVDRLALEKFIGPAFVEGHEGELSAADARELLERAGRQCREARKRILIRGRATVTAEAAAVFAQAGIDLIGNESQTVGPEEAPMEVHRILLGAEVVLLEGIRLANVEEGAYILHAAPLNLGGAEGAPCRATLISPDL